MIHPSNKDLNVEKMKFKAMEYNPYPDSNNNEYYFTIGAVLGVLKMIYSFYASTPLLAETFGSALFKTGLTMLVGGITAVVGKNIGVLLWAYYKKVYLNWRSNKNKNEKNA